MHCVNCHNNLHTSIKLSCPTKAKVRQQKINIEATTEFDTSGPTSDSPPNPNHMEL